MLFHSETELTEVVVGSPWATPKKIKKVIIRRNNIEENQARNECDARNVL